MEDSWKKEIDQHLKLFDARDMVDEIIKAGNLAFADTPYKDTWVLAHDALGQLWEPGTRDYLKSQEFDESQILAPQAGTSADIKHHKDRPVGNSPELMPLDSHLFADFKRAIIYNVASTAEYANDNPKKFKLGTPKEVFSSMQRAWKIHPTPERIVQDVLKWPKNLDKIYAAQGAVVPEVDNRHGRRETTAFKMHADCAEAEAIRERRYEEWARAEEADGGTPRRSALNA